MQANQPREFGRWIFGGSEAAKLHRLLPLLAFLCLMSVSAAPAQTNVRAQANVDKLKTSFLLLAKNFSYVAERLDRAASLAESAGRIVGDLDASGDSTQPPPAAIDRGAATPSLASEEALQKIVSRRSQALALAQSLSVKFSGAQRAGTEKRTVERQPAAINEANFDLLLNLSAEIAAADFRSDVQAAQASLDMMRKAAQDAARDVWSTASRETIDGVVPKRIAAKVVPVAGSRADFTSMSVEDLVFLVLLLSADDAQEDLRTVMQSLASANERLYWSATKAQSTIDSSRIDVRLALANAQLFTSSVGSAKGDDIASSVGDLINRSGPSTTDAHNQIKLKKLADELGGLKKRKRELTRTIADLEAEIAELDADCVAAASRVAAAKAKALAEKTKGASAGAVIGGIFGGPVGALIGVIAGAAASGGPSPVDMAKLNDCKRLAELLQKLEEVRNQLAEIEQSIKTALNAIEAIKRAAREELDAQKKWAGSGLRARPGPRPSASASKAGSGIYRQETGEKTIRPPGPTRNSAMDRLGDINTSGGIAGVVGNAGGLDNPRPVPCRTCGVANQGASRDYNKGKAGGGINVTSPQGGHEVKNPQPPANATTQAPPQRAGGPANDIDYGGCARCGQNKFVQPR